MPAIVVKQYGSRSFNVRVLPKGPVWKRHLEQLQPRHTSEMDPEPSDRPSEFPVVTDHLHELEAAMTAKAEQPTSKFKKVRFAVPEE